MKHFWVKILLLSIIAGCIAGLCVKAYADFPEVTYYPSGNIKDFTTSEGYKYIYMDENYYQPQKETGQGRLMRYEMLDSSSRAIEYYDDSSKWIETIVDGDDVMTFFKEDYFLHRRVVEDSQGNIVEAVPLVNKEEFNFDCYVTKRDVKGNIYNGWPKIYGGKDNYQIMAVTVDSNDDVILTYTINGNGMILKYTPNGVLQWYSEVSKDEDNHLLCVTTDSDNNIIVVGWRGNYSQYDFLVLKYDPDGILLWEKRYGKEDINFLHDVYIDKDDNITILGQCYSSDNDEDYHYALNYNPAGDLIGEGFAWIGQYEIDMNTGGVPGRQYTHLYQLEGMPESVTEFSYAYYKYMALIELQKGTPLGDFTIFAYPETSSEVKIYGMDNIKRKGSKWEFKSEQFPIEVIEAVEINYPIGGMQISKIVYRNGNTAWFLWGENVFQVNGNLYSNVVIEHRGTDDSWCAYRFIPSSDFLEMINILTEPSNWEFIDTIDQPDLSILPELGDWWQYCFSNKVIPEFVPLSSDYTYDRYDRVIQRVDHNPYMDTTYTYEWGGGEMLMEMLYDYDKDGDLDIVYYAEYANGDDCDISHIDQWPIIDECYGPNRPPEIEPIGDKEVDEWQLLRFPVRYSDPEGDAVEIVLLNQPIGATFDYHREGNLLGYFNWRPTYEQSGIYTRVAFIVGDGRDSDIELITITVENVNRPPEIDQIVDRLVVNERDLVSIAVNASDPEGDPLTYTWKQLEGPVVTLDESDPLHLKFVAPSVKGDTMLGFELVVSDGEYSDSAKVEVIVRNINNAPRMSYLINFWNKWFLWAGRDLEDRGRIHYLYKVDNGEWSKPTRRRWIRITDISESLSSGSHKFYIRAIDSQGEESQEKNTRFYVRKRRRRPWWWFWFRRR